ncbi:Glycine betaine ABC transport system, glycine betaine-binding protein OpuAC [Candidatus Syntrophocurvum alkaliphilum]|uniref:Glycine betaine ABC transport system, glycine betaine-binding protein OpuAC n=1 Tax=Candidatus Syntrophocurvum alkaliphilum TaxID=2293317 RepID=A0A6I6DH43_9FIRM|nr:glycine betaine ABC transporter substrate-binding protein [Candidatus Syntrophocurvum alkaliphilum]QGU00413.1 Glycine betaine ABC transport system, glycine betaine-binding protein OpuAC [Candidatus Syntrophocurvum alkaliphilum]
MFIKSKKLVISLSILLIFSITIMGCGLQGDEEHKGDVRIVYVEWVCATASSYVIADILENKMGYNVEVMPLSVGAMFEGLVSGDGDFMTTAWLPVTHKNYMDTMGDDFDFVGINTEGAYLGLVVPDYVTISSIEEMAEYKDKFKGEIVGIDPGASMMAATEQLIIDYDLEGFNLVEGTDATMTAALSRAIERDEWVAVTGWTPHWKFSRWNLKFLEDPKGLYGEEEYIGTIARKGLNEDMPEVYELISNFEWDVNDLASAIELAEEEGATSESAAAKWVEENEDLVNNWLPEAYK